MMRASNTITGQIGESRTMSKISLAILCTVIGAIIVGMYLEVEALSGGVGAFIVIALVYSFVVAKREAALMSHVMDQQKQTRPETRFREDVIVPEWLRRVPGQPA
jgi:hypothetical protein